MGVSRLGVLGPAFLVAVLVEHRFPDPEDRYAPTAERLWPGPIRSAPWPASTHPAIEST